MMIVLGNGTSFFARELGFLFAPVANLVGLNTTWNFFSPDPAHTMYLRYRVYFDDAYGNPTKEAIEDYFPEKKHEGDFRPHIRRMNYVMRFFTANSERMQKYFVPWLCRRYPGSTRVQTEVELHRIPNLEVASKLSAIDYDELTQQEEINQNESKCI